MSDRPALSTYTTDPASFDQSATPMFQVSTGTHVPRQFDRQWHLRILEAVAEYVTGQDRVLKINRSGRWDIYWAKKPKACHAGV